MNLPWVIYLLILTALELIGDTFAKQYAVTGRLAYSFLAILFIAVGNISWQAMLRSGVDLSRGGILFSILTAIGFIVIGIFGFKESLNSYQFAGLFFGVIAIVLLSISD